MEKYNTPDMEIINLLGNDIVTISGDDFGDGPELDGDWNS